MYVEREYKNLRHSLPLILSKWNGDFESSLIDEVLYAIGRLSHFVL